MDVELSALPFGLRTYGPDGNWSFEDGVLTGWAGPRQDRFVPPTGEGLDPASDAPRLLGAPPAGDFQLIARVTVGFSGAFDAGVLYVHVGERAWAKLCLEYSPDVPTVCTVVTRGHSDDANSFTVDGSSVWLRVSRTGRAFAFHASRDGVRWIFVRLFTLGTEKESDAALVGFMAQAPMGEGCVVTYDHIAYRPAWPADLRDGS
ncbi:MULTISPECIES: DUF1349 domain-containing protein [Streptomyces]|uniref:DUF1349 domain-containing protein n=1 Tax=Streptomyces doudnae TaxID=3075536 RepID=A0ABD5ETS0_9ACTN|nr:MULTISPECIES: DUF1349 domain-containing protein [unclassified Streptomyces]MDT0437745.1 DUF1349 domain-containing protein [Streptomyces sp. DSM 41981]MYQ66977.1 DUF1349 domain-containing protein [Streptomyces sp. SID4950]SCE28206.1 hypothetical protein GA0115242_128523 [Streptomyces sp. SolWspMP-5a-2]